jgi:putative Holliday junction resolvase
VRILGLDYGDKRIGVALSDETATLATGLESIRCVGPRKDVQAVVKVAREHDAGEIVVGLPRNMDGSMGPRAQKTLEFIERVKSASRLSVVPWDERLSTMAAERVLIEGKVSRRGRKAVVDKVSATLILQNYLDFRKMAQVSAVEGLPEDRL